MNIKPLFDKVILRPSEAENTTAGGIILPGSGEAPNKGEVLAIGSKCEEVKIGDKVLFESFAVKEIKNNDETLLVLKEEDITAIIK